MTQPPTGCGFTTGHSGNGLRIGGEEFDAGVRYPTLVQDSNGNQVLLTYDFGALDPNTNTSGRITTIKDARAPEGYPTYGFSYYPAFPAPGQRSRLIGVSDWIGAGTSFRSAIPRIRFP